MLRSGGSPFAICLGEARAAFRCPSSLPAGPRYWRFRSIRNIVPSARVCSLVLASSTATPRCALHSSPSQLPLCPLCPHQADRFWWRVVEARIEAIQISFNLSSISVQIGDNGRMWREANPGIKKRVRLSGDMCPSLLTCWCIETWQRLERNPYPGKVAADSPHFQTIESLHRDELSTRYIVLWRGGVPKEMSPGI